MLGPDEPIPQARAMAEGFALSLLALYPCASVAVTGDDARSTLRVSLVVVSARETTVAHSSAALYWGRVNLTYVVDRGQPARDTAQRILAHLQAHVCHASQADRPLAYLGEVFDRDPAAALHVVGPD